MHPVAYVSNKYKQPSFVTVLQRALLYTSRHVADNSKPSSGVVAYRILKVSNRIKILTDPLNLC
jgi:hypothetical protein